MSLHLSAAGQGPAQGLTGLCGPGASRVGHRGGWVRRQSGEGQEDGQRRLLRTGRGSPVKVRVWKDPWGRSATELFGRVRSTVSLRMGMWL